MNATRAPVASSSARTGWPTQSSCSGTSTMATVPVGSRHTSATPSRHEVPHHPVGRPRHRGHGRDAQPLVHLGPLLVVDPGHHPLDAERLPGQPGGDDVRVVAAGHGREGVGPLDAGLDRAPRGRSPTPVTGRPAKSGPSRRNASGFWSMTATACPRRSRLCARVEPTRPHPMITMCTLILRPSRPSWHACRRRDYRALRARRRSGAVAPTLRPWPSSPTSVPSGSCSAGRSAPTGCSTPLLPKRIALPVFASDALSSVAYAPRRDPADAVHRRASRRTRSRPGSRSRSSW